MVGGVVLLLILGWAGQAQAQIGVGTWVRTDLKAQGMTMTVEKCCNGGLRLTYHIAMGNQPPTTMTVDSPMDGTEVPVFVGGKPSGETMSIKRVDDHHISTVMTMNGKPFGTSNATLSADGKTMTVESVTQMSGAKSEKVTETWVKK